MRKRGKRFARRVDTLAAFRAAGRQHTLDDTQKTRLAVHLRVNLQALATGEADENAFHNLAGGVNVSMVLAERGCGIEHEETIGNAQMALVRLRANGNRGRWLMDGPGLVSLKAWLDVYEAQLEVVSQQETLDALEEVRKRVEKGWIFKEAA